MPGERLGDNSNALGPASLSLSFGVARMRPALRTIVALLGLVATLSGIGLFVDGLLPTRSHGPNPSSLAVVLGFVVALAGLLVRRKARHGGAHGHTAQ